MTPKRGGVAAGAGQEPCHQRGATARSDHASLPADEHLVQFYEDASTLALDVAQFVADGLKTSDVVIAITTTEHRDLFSQRLTDIGIDVGTMLSDGRLTFLDAHETLASFMRDGIPDRDLFGATVAKLIAAKAADLPQRARLRAYGDMVDVLWQSGQKSAAIHLEELWNDLQGRHRFTLLCAYAMASFYKQPAELQRVCATHTHVVGGNGDAEAQEAAPFHPAREPPQYLLRLEQEVARRAEVENALRVALRELRAKEEDLRQSEEQLRDFVENATLGLHRVAPDGTILWANRAELELLGYEEHEYVGRPIADFHADSDVIADILTRLTRGEALHNYQARLRAKDGSIKHVLINSNVHVRQGRFIHTRCFTRDVTERRRAEEALRQSHRQLEFITDALPVLVAFVDAGQRYQFASAAYERWFGHAKKEVIGRHLRDVLGDDAYRAVETHVTSALAGESVTFEAEVPYRDGGVRWIEATYIPQRDDTQKIVGFVALVADVTQRINFERFRAAAAARAERLLKITEAIATAVSEEDVFAALVDRVSDSIGASSAGLWLVHDDAGVANLVRSVGYSASTRERIESLTLDRSPPVPATECIRTGEPIWIPCQAAMLERYPHLASVVTPGRSYRVACLPLVANGRILGTLGVTLEEARDETEDEREFLLLVARYATQALERLRLLDAERRSRADADAAAARLSVLGRASRTFANPSLDLGARLDDVVSELARTLNSCVGIALVESDGLIHPTAVRHPIAEANEILARVTPTAPLKPGEGVTGTIVATGKGVLLPVIDQALPAASPEPYRAFLERYPFYALMGAALRVQGRVIGTVTATRYRPGETYTHDDLQLLEELAERAAAAIENGRLYEESIQGRKRAEQLYHFAQSVVSAERVEDVFDAAMVAIENALGAPRSAVLTYDDEGVMRFRAWRNLSDAYRVAVEGHSPWPPDEAAPEPVLVHDAQQDEAMTPYLPLFQQEGIGALAFIPLVTRGRLLGKFMFYHEGPHVFTESEVETAQAIANHLASVSARFSAMAKLEDTVRQNELFAGVLAHDLRNPLGAMTTAAQLLLMRFEGEKTLGERETKPLSRILSSGQRMNTMIEQLLDFTRLRSGSGIPIEPHDANLAELCDQVVGELEVGHPEWRIERNAAGDQWGSWDSERLLQVLSNLIANACQHGCQDAPVSVTLDGAAKHEVRIEVRNSGAIPESLLSTLFDPFRSSLHRPNRSRGLGLGLFIVRAIVHGHGGSVEVRSTEADGTSFLIRLPRQSQISESELRGSWRLT